MISEQVLRDLREIAAAATLGIRADGTLNDAFWLNDSSRRLVFRVLPALLDEVAEHRRENTVVGDADRVQHLPEERLSAMREAAEAADDEHLHVRGVPGPWLLGLLDYVAHLQTARIGLRRALLQQQPDGTLAKDFLALYQAARLVTSAPHATGGDVEGLALHVVRLAPLYDDIRMQLSRPPRIVMREDIDPSMLDLRPGPITRASDAPTVGVRMSEVDPSVYDLPLPLPGNVDPAHTVRVLNADGSVSVECDHAFLGLTGNRCAHCGKPFAELRAELARDLRLPSLLPDGVLTATPDELADIVQRQVEEHEGRGIINREAVDRMLATARVDRGVAPDEVLLTFTEPLPPDADELAVPVILGSTLRPRIEALVATRRIGDDLERVVQTLFVLGMLEAERQDAVSHVGEPKLHVSGEALFVRFALPHEDRAQRAAILRQLFLDLAEWCDEGDPVRPAFLAAIEVLPRRQ